MVLRLIGGQAGDRRQDAERIGRQEDHFGGVTRFGNRFNNVVDMVDGVGDAGVFSLRTVIEIDRAIGAHHHVFQQSIAANGVIDIRLGRFRELDGLGVAAPFEVKHAVVIPAMFIIANQAAFWIGGEGGFAGA